MGENFRNWIFDLLAPENCYACKKLSSPICSKCLSKNANVLLKINQKTSPASKIFYLAERAQNPWLKKLVDDLKLRSNRVIAKSLAQILAENLKNYPDFADSFEDLIFVAPPTSRKHIRSRGFCHTGLILRHFSKITGAKIGREVARFGNLTQTGADKKTRKSQAGKSYFLKTAPQKDKIYVVFDDIRTTGATQDAIARILLDGDVREVWAVSILHQGKK